MSQSAGQSSNQALLEREALDEADAYAVAGIARPSAAEHPVAARA